MLISLSNGHQGLLFTNVMPPCSPWSGHERNGILEAELVTSSNLGGPLSCISNSLLLKMAIEIVELPIKH